MVLSSSKSQIDCGATVYWWALRLWQLGAPPICVSTPCSLGSVVFLSVGRGQYVWENNRTLGTQLGLHEGGVGGWCRRGFGGRAFVLFFSPGSFGVAFLGLRKHGSLWLEREIFVYGKESSMTWVTCHTLSHLDESSCSSRTFGVLIP